MSMLKKLLKRGWQIVTEAHTAIWLFFDVLAAALPASILTYAATWLGEHSVAMLFMVFAITAAASFVSILVLLGYRAERNERRQAATRSTPSPSIAWPIRELFAHIRPDLPLKSKTTINNATFGDLDERWKSVGDNVIRQLSIGQLHAVGRREEYRPLRHLAPAPIPSEYWRSAKFTYYFLDQDGRVMDHVVNDDGIRYSELEVDRAEALAIWPVEPWPNFKKWDEKEELELYEAACLWFEKEPKLPMLSLPQAKYQEWRDKIFGGGIPVITESARHAVEIGAGRESAITPHTKIHREVLKGIAEHDGIEPRFLYPHRRGE
jgi:hypothetical protein